MSRVLQFAVIWGEDVVSFAVLVPKTCHLANLASWEAIGRFRGTWEQKKGDLGVPGLGFCRFGGISGPPFGS